MWTCCNSGACVDAIFMLLEFVTHDNRPSDHRWISSFSPWICERCTFTVDDAEVGICYSSHVVSKNREFVKIFRQFERIAWSSVCWFLDPTGEMVPKKKKDNPTSLLLVESSSWYCLMVYWNPARVEHGRMERWIIFIDCFWWGVGWWVVYLFCLFH